MAKGKDQETYIDLRRRYRNVIRLAASFLVAAFIIMAGWGWTPLKKTVPAIYPLTLWGFLCVVAVILFIRGVIHDIRSRSLKNWLQDQEPKGDDSPP